MVSAIADEDNLQSATDWIQVKNKKLTENRKADESMT